MSAADSPVRVALRQAGTLTVATTRHSEPVTVGIPLPRGLASDPAAITVESEDGATCRTDVNVLDRWPDGSIRWLLVDFKADVVDGVARGYTLRVGRVGDAPKTSGSIVSESPELVRVDTGRAVFEFRAGGSFPLSNVTAGAAPVMIDSTATGLRIHTGGKTLAFVVKHVTVLDRGPERVEIEMTGNAAGEPADGPLQVYARVQMFARSGVARFSVTIRNSQHAHHPGGRWELGDPGSILLDSAVVSVSLPSAIAGAVVALERGAIPADVQLPFDLYQESSGGEHWDSPSHKTPAETGRRFRGYVATEAGAERTGLRAAPTLIVETGAGAVAAAMPGFWQQFPRGLSVKDRAIEFGLFPRQDGRATELQGGEQKTHEFTLAFGGDAISDPPLAWCHDPLVLTPAPEWYAHCEVAPFLITAATDPGVGYLELVASALDGPANFFHKREIADEYGWRNFGDLPADHESAYQPADRPFVSHYNNQYDAVAGFALHFMRTGDPRWRELMADLARHVTDIDVYHTRTDKAAYNGGLFWHTAHYVDAGLSTHRTYSRDTAGGGPSSEHNYNQGLMLHYFLTGDRASKEAAIGLGQWVIDMDDGSQTVFRWLASGATGHASLTLDYHGPGRGAGHSILACLIAHRLSGEAKYLLKAEELIRRCINPSDDVDARGLLDAERRWSYTAFLQALGIYLYGKLERGEVDEMYGYARASLLVYARWMSSNERPYLDHPEILEYPNETWAAQDLRKADVFLWAATLSDGDERTRFLACADRFFEYSVAKLRELPTSTYARPLVLMLTQGYRYGWFAASSGALAAPVLRAAPDWKPSGFVPQKARAMKRATLAVVIAAAVIVSAALTLVVHFFV